jgi:FkbM family methyltransferase
VVKKLLKNVLIRLSGNAFAQRALERNVAVSLYLMGIGAGSPLSSSGEQVILEFLTQKAAQTRPLLIFDVGANQGQFLGLLARGLQGYPHAIHAFEPGQYTYKILCDNARDYPNVTLNNLGLGKQAGEFDLFYDQPGSGLASLSQRKLENWGIDFKYSEKVNLDTLDHYCAQHAIQAIDLLKLDVEGHELDVLEGGRQMFASRKIRMVSFEFGGGNIDSRTYLRDFFDFFQAYGLRELNRILPSGRLAPLRQCREIDEQFRTTNFLALLDGA